MDGENLLHLVDECPQSQVEQAMVARDIGYRCEFHSNIEGLTRSTTIRGVVLANQDCAAGCAKTILQTLAEQDMWLPLIGVSRDPQPRRVVCAVKSGVLDYLSLPLDPESLRSALADIKVEAEACYAAQSKLIAARNRIAQLSPREREVLDKLAEGGSNKLIARDLAISPRTVEIHRANMMTKLGANHAAEAVRIWTEAAIDRERALPTE